MRSVDEFSEFGSARFIVLNEYFDAFCEVFNTNINLGYIGFNQGEDGIGGFSEEHGERLSDNDTIHGSYVTVRDMNIHVIIRAFPSGRTKK